MAQLTRESDQDAIAGNLVVLDLLRADDHADVEQRAIVDLIDVRSSLLDQPFHRLTLLGALGQVELFEDLVEPLDLRSAARW